MRTGVANLPLHYGKAPAWLFGRMKKLAREIALVVVTERGADEFLNKISDPFWFQAFGCVLGFDWHSSGLTTTVCGALKEGLKGVSGEIGLFVCGGKGGVSRKTPLEIEDIGSRRLVDADPDKLIYSSKMAAKVDSCALQDGYQLYHHCFVFGKNGNWAVIQQGMNAQTRWARRYHWLGTQVDDFVCEPHKAICCDFRAEALNMVARESNGARTVSAALAGEEHGKVIAEFGKVCELNLPRRHDVTPGQIKKENLKKILQRTYEKKPENFEALLGTQGVGPRTVRALALISELIYAKPPSFEDPARFSFAHGGKDGHPYPVNKKGYDQSIQTLRDAVGLARIGRTEKLAALRRLSKTG